MEGRVSTSVTDQDPILLPLVLSLEEGHPLWKKLPHTRVKRFIKSFHHDTRVGRAPNRNCSKDSCSLIFLGPRQPRRSRPPEAPDAAPGASAVAQQHWQQHWQQQSQEGRKRVDDLTRVNIRREGREGSNRLLLTSLQA